MFRNLLSATIVLSIASITACDAASFEFKPVKVDLPDSDKMFPGGSAADAIHYNCLACHSAGMVLNQPALSKEAWTLEVHKMINNYRAPVALEDVAAIVDYLTTLKGAK